MELTGNDWEKTEIVFEGKSFVFLHTDVQDHIFSTIQRTRSFYEIELLNALGALVQPGDWVVDAGANIGNHAVYFAGICGCHVMAFEPNPVAAEILRRNVEANELGDRIEIHEVALGSHASSGDVVVPEGHNLGMATVRVAEGGAGAVRIDLLSNYIGSRTIRLLKIDTEGMDYEVLAGGQEVLARDGCAVSIEAGSREGYLRIAELMERYGYTTASSYNYTPTHIFLHERQDNPQAFKARMTRQTSLSYIDYTSIRDALDRNRREASTQVGQLAAAIELQTRGLPMVLSSAQSAETATIHTHLEAGFSHISKEIAELAGKAEGFKAQINGMTDLPDALRQLDEKVDRGLAELEAGNTHLHDVLKQADMKAYSQMAEVFQSLQQLEERAISRHAASMASAESLAKALSGWKDDVETLFQCSMLAADVDNLRDAAQVQEQKLLQSDIFVSQQHMNDRLPLADMDSRTEQNRKLDANYASIPQSAKSLEAPAIRSVRKRRAGVATTPNRVAMLEQAVISIAPQVDEIHVFLNGHESVPSFLKGVPTVSTYLSRDHDDLGDAGKFRGLPKRQDGFYLSFDDDIVYPLNYAERLTRAVEQYRCPAGVHGSIIRRDIASYYTHQGRHVFHFRDKLERDIPVDIIGTGTFCSDLERHPLIVGFDYRNMADLWVAEYYRQKQVPLLCVARDYEWLKPIETDVLSIWDSNQANQSIQRTIVEEKTRTLAKLPRPITPAMPRVFIGIKTYNRKEYIQQSIESVIRTLEPGYDYILAIADDGSEDGTLDYLDNLRLPVDLKIIRNKRRYAAGQFNELVRYGLERNCEYFFLLDDDVVFRKTGWISAYRSASLESGYDHLCHYNLPHHAQLAPRRGVDPVPTELKSGQYSLSAYGTVEQCMGALMTLTPRVIEKIGFADETNFFVRGQWHVDISARACRAGFNEYSRFFDLRNSNDYIELQNTIAQEYKTSITWDSEEFKRAAASEEVTRRKAIVRMRNRIHSPAISEFLSKEASVLPPLHINEAFDRVLVLNLDRRPDRMEMISERMKKADIRFERFSAVDGQNPAVKEAYDVYTKGIRNFPASKIQNSLEFHQGGYSASEQARFIQAASEKPAIRSTGAWAYLLGYREILCRALEEGWESFLVLDDDCVFHSNFSDVFDRAMYELPSNWHILHLGTMQYDWELTEQYSEHLYMPNGFIVGSHAVAYRRAAIPGLLNWIDMMNLPYDVGPLQKESFLQRDRTFVVLPNLAIQDDLSSDINSSDVDPQHVRMQGNKFRWNLDDYRY